MKPENTPWPLLNFIVSTPGTCGGRPRIDNSRITVETVMNYVHAGSTVSHILKEYPQLTEKGVMAAIAFAAREAALAAITARVGELEAALKDCADDLEAEISTRHLNINWNEYPGLRGKYEQDMAPVRRARALLDRQGEP